MSRTRTRERRQEREKERRRQRQFVIVGVVAAVAVLAVILFLLVNQPAEAPIPEYALTRYVDVEQGLSEEGYPRIGNPDAPVRVKEYSSFDCPHCRDFHDEVFPALLDRAKAGEIIFTYVPLHSTGSVRGGVDAAHAALCAAQQDVFWPFHDTLFNWQGVYVNQAFTFQRMASGADGLGLDRTNWENCYRGASTDEVLRVARAEAESLVGFQGTPTVTVNGEIVPSPDLATINNAIDAALASAPAEPAVDDSTPEVDAESEVTEEAEASETEAAEETPTEEVTEASEG
jgi:protein-disulfide isomerase